MASVVLRKLLFRTHEPWLICTPSKDGGVSTADTVADGGVDEDQPEDGDFKP